MTLRDEVQAWRRGGTGSPFSRLLNWQCNVLLNLWHWTIRDGLSALKAAIFQISSWSSWGSLGKMVNSVSANMLTDGCLFVRGDVEKMMQRRSWCLWVGDHMGAGVRGEPVLTVTSHSSHYLPHYPYQPKSTSFSVYHLNLTIQESLTCCKSLPCPHQQRPMTLLPHPIRPLAYDIPNRLNHLKIIVITRRTKINYTAL